MKAILLPYNAHFSILGNGSEVPETGGSFNQGEGVFCGHTAVRPAQTGRERPSYLCSGNR